MSEEAIQIKQEVEEKPGYKQTKHGWIPEDWELKQLGDDCSFTQGVQIPYGEQIDTPKKGFIRYLYIRDFFTDDFICYVKDIYPAKIMNTSDIMMVNTGNTAGKVYSGASGVLSNNAFKISFSNSFERDFLLIYLQSDFTQKRIQSFFNSAGQPHVGHKNVALIPIPLPPLPEQQKIAQILRTWDKTITKTEQLIAKKQERKKGLMQQLLTGKKRFKEFVKSDKMKETKLGLIPEDWEVQKVSDVFDFLSTNSFSRNQMHYNHSVNSIYNIHYGDIHATYQEAILDFDIEESVPVISDEIEISNSATFLNDGDVIIADASEDYKGVGEAIELKNINEKKVLAGLHTFALRDKSSLTSIGFRAYIFKSPKVSKAIKVIATGSKVFGISKANLQKFELVLPPIQEQQRIAYVLSSANQEISSLQNQLEKLKDQKKGLMQKLLTGEVRVKID